jgi:hypothetical protein
MLCAGFDVLLSVNEDDSLGLRRITTAQVGQRLTSEAENITGSIHVSVVDQIDWDHRHPSAALDGASTDGCLAA